MELRLKDRDRISVLRQVNEGVLSAAAGAARLGMTRRGWSPPGHTLLGTRLRSLRSLRSGPQGCAIFDGP